MLFISSVDILANNIRINENDKSETHTLLENPNELMNCIVSPSSTPLAHWNMDQCNSDDSFNEFTAIISNNGLAQVTNALIGSTYNRNGTDPDTKPLETTYPNLHECGYGANGSAAGDRAVCLLQDVYGSTYAQVENAYQFAELTVSPNSCGAITKFEASINYFSMWGNGPSTMYVRVKKNGAEIYLDQNITVVNGFHLYSFDFSDLPEFEVTSTSTFRFEFLGYNDLAGSSWVMTEVDYLKIYGGGGQLPATCDGNINSIQLTNGTESITLQNGGTYQYCELPTNNYLEAVVSGTHQSFQFTVDGNNRTENSEPYNYPSVSNGATWNPPAGTHTIRGRLYSEDALGGLLCDEVNMQINIEACEVDPCATAGGDSDNDGVCNDQDCYPLNPSLPAPIGTACNDGDSSTQNDIILSDGCTCQGTTNPTEGLQNENYTICKDDQVCNTVATNDDLTGLGDDPYTIVSSPPTGDLTFSSDGSFCYTNSQAGTYSFTYSVTKMNLVTTTAEGQEVCAGKVKDICAEYSGPSGATISVYNRDYSILIGELTNVQTGDVVCFHAGDNVSGGNAVEWNFMVNGSLNTAIHTSCSVSLLYHQFGYFYLTTYGDFSGNNNNYYEEVVCEATATITVEECCTIVANATGSTNAGSNTNTGSDLLICDPQSMDLNASSTGEQGGVSYQWSNGQSGSNISVNVSSSGTYAVTATDAAGCTSTDQVTVTLPEFSIDAGVDQMTCNAGDCFTIGANPVGPSGANYSWSTGQSGNIKVNGNNLDFGQIQVCPTETTTYTLTVDYSGCQKTDEVTVTVGGTSANAGVDQTVCSGETITLTATGGDNYEWSNGENTNAITVTPSVATNYSVTVTDELGCTSTDVVAITVEECCTLSATAIGSVGSGANINTGSDLLICDPQLMDLNASSTGEQGSISYQWSNGMTGSDISIDVTSSGTYSVTATDSEGCTSTDQVSVTLPIFSIDAGVDQSTCNAGDCFTIGANPVGPQGANYSWSTGQSGNIKMNGNNADFGQIQVCPTETTTYILTVDYSGCQETDEVTVTVGGTSANAGADQTVCSGETITLTATGGDNYEWSNGENTNAITVIPTVATNYSVTVTDAIGCTSTDVVAITVENCCTLSASATGDVGTGAETNILICEPQSVDLTASSTGAEGNVSYEWSNGMTGSNITIDVTASTTISVTATDEEGCTSTDQVTITLPNVTADAGADQTTCNAGDCFTIGANPVGPQNADYSWSTGESGSIKLNGNNADFGQIQVCPTETTTYTLSVSANGCTKTDEVTINVGGENVANAGSDQTVCLGESITITATGGDNFAWSNGENTNSITITPTVATTYTVTLTDDAGCTSSDEVAVIVENCCTLNASVTGDAGAGAETNILICEPQSVDLTASSTGEQGSLSYEWSNGMTGSNITIDVTASTSISVTATDSEGCTSTDQLAITLPNVTADAGADQMSCTLGECFTIGANPVGPQSTDYVWSTGESGRIKLNGNNADFGQIQVCPTETTTYSLSVSDGNCTKTDEITITVDGVAPVISSLATDITLSCEEEIPASIDPEITDNLDTDIQVTYNEEEIAGTCAEGYSITRTWVAEDDCGNVTTVQQVITIEDTVAPVIEALLDLTVDCNSIPEAQIPTVTDNCDTEVQLLSNEEVLSSECTDAFEIKRTWTATDNCNNVSTIVQSIVVEDVTAPVITNSINDITVEAANIPEPYIITTTDDCDTDVDVIFNEMTVPNGCDYVINRTWSASDNCGNITQVTQQITVSSDFAISISASNDISCFGANDGNATISTLGGVAPFVYEWSNGNTTATASNLAADIYTVKVSDASGCEQIAEVTITEPQALECDTEVTNTISIQGANDGAITVNVAGGSAPFTYAWSDQQNTQTATQLSSGTYTVTITDTKGCTCSAGVTLDGPAKIGDTVWEDTDGDGIQDPEEPGIEGVNVTLTGTDVNGNTVTGTTTTDANGNYIFDNLEPGDYYVTFGTPTGYEPTQVNQGSNEANDSDADPTMGGMTETVTISEGQYYPDFDAGFYQTTSIGNYVWYDTDEDGIQDTNEIGVEGVTVQLIAAGDDGVFGTDDDVIEDTATTDATGAYVFSDVIPGVYIIVFDPNSIPDGFELTAQDQGTELEDSDANTTTGQTDPFTVSSGQQDDLSYDAGISPVCDNLTAEATSNDVLDCNNLSVQLNGTASDTEVTYSWVGPNGFSSTDQNPSVNEVGTYVLTVTTANACEASAEVIVEENLDTPNVTVQDNKLTCEAISVQLEANSTTTGVTYKWIGPNGYSSTDQNPSVNEAGIYVLTVIAPNGCEASAEAIVSQDMEAPQISTQAGILSCTNMEATIAGIFNSDVETYRWTGPNGFESTDQNPVVNNPGTYILTATAANGCQATAEAIVETDTSMPSINPVGGVLTCTESTVQLTGNFESEVFSFSWTGPNGFTSTDQNPTVDTEGTYTLTAFASNGCSTSMEAFVTTDFVAPNVDAIGGTVSCNNPEVQLTGAFSADVQTFEWTGPLGFTSTDQNPIATYVGTYTLTAKGANGCETIVETIVDEDTAKPEAHGLSNGILTCESPEVIISAVSATQNVTFLWTGPNGFETTVQNPSVSEAGTYELIVTGENGCETIEYVLVMEDTAMPDATAQGGMLTCDNPTTQLTGSSSIADVTYEWVGPNGYTNTTQNPIVSSAGTYTLTVAAANGCTATAEAIVEIDNNAPEANAIVNGVITCIDQEVQLQGTSATDNTYKWTGPNGFISTDQNPLVNAAGEYTLTVFNANGCSAAVNVIVEQDIDAPTASAEGGTISCANGEVMLNAISTTTGVSYAWTGPNAFSSTEQNPVVNEAGTYEVRVIASNGCSNTAQAIVSEETTVPQASIASSGQIECEGSTVTLDASTSTSGVTYEWTGPNGFTSTDAAPVVDQEGNYVLTITNPINGCTANAETLVTKAVCGSIGDYVWEDVNGNGIQDPDESGIAGVTVTLIGVDANGVPINLDTVTDTDGSYSFDGLDAGEYQVTVETPTNYIPTVQNGGNDDEDSDIDPTDGTSQVIILNEGDAYPDLDAGYYLPTSLGDYVWEDLNGDGIQDLNEPAIEGITVTLNGTDGAGNTVTQTSSTDSNGYYEFTNLSPGTYAVQFTAPTGFIATAADQDTNDANDSDADPISGISHTVTLFSGDNDPTIDAGFVNSIKIGNHVWEDLNRDGIQDPNEPGVAGVVVALVDAGDDGIFGTSDDIPVEVVSTLADGSYCFFSAIPGEYQIRFILSSLPDGYIFTSQDQTTDDLDSDVDPTGATDSFVIQSGDVNNTFDAGVVSACDNVTDGGTIGVDEVGCAPFYDPTMITELASPTGGSGSIQYIWLKSTQATMNGPLLSDPNWQLISGATGPDYDPGAISETTYFIRCVRREGCNFFVESNMIVKTVDTDQNACAIGVEVIMESCGSLSIVNESEVNIDWTTSEEPENVTFVIERSTDGITFDAIEAIAGTGYNTSTTNDYNYIDTNPIIGDVFYRVKVVYDSGSFQFCETQSINIPLPLRQSNGINVYPTITQDQTTVRLDEPLKMDAYLELVDEIGKVLATRMLPAGSVEVNFDLTGLQQATYYIYLNSNGGRELVNRVVKITP